MDDDEAQMPGAFPTASEDSPATTRTPKRRFVGRRTADAQAKEKQDANSSVEETTAVVQKGMQPLFVFTGSC
jgi:hypothetical protein